MTFKMLTQLSSVHFLITFLTQHLGLSIFDPNVGWNNQAFFRVELCAQMHVQSAKCNVAIDLQASAPTVTYNSLGIKGKMMTQF